jgi:hypothetical protein
MRTGPVGAVFLLLVAAGCHGTFRDLPVQGGTAESSRVEPRLTKVGSALVGEQVEVRCWSQSEWREQIEDGDANSPHVLAGMAGEGGPVDLAPDACRPLVEMLYTQTRPVTREQQIALAYAVGILSHELEHVRGEMDEETAECHGMQRLSGTARKLGLRAAEARRLARLHWLEVYPDSDRLYRTPECRNGGELDLRRRSSVWP